MWNPFVKKVDIEKLIVADDARMDAIIRANYRDFLERAYRYSSVLVLGHVVDENRKLEYLKFINTALSLAIQEIGNEK